ncbi:DUF1573 domain-containing protein [Pedobacter sp.]|uniref:DUF1573 domain-containing protein n=1 Tax=Pedobacter sp. TaxID=1411316 RepID=UPI003D7FED4E
MKKLIILFSLVLGIALSSKAQNKPAEFKFDKETYNFGKIPSNKPATVEFTFTNIGDTPLIISNVETTCGCTVPEYTKTPIKKGETGVIKVTYNPTGAALPFSKSISLTSNAKTPTKVLYIKGETVSAAN